MKEEKNNFGILILGIALVFVVFGVFIYYKNYKDNLPVKKEEKEKIEHKKEFIGELYNNIKFTYENDIVISTLDLDKMKKGYTVSEFSEDLIISYGLIHLEENDIGHEANYRPVADKDGYRYTGTYVKASLVKGHVNHVLGSGITYNDKTVTFRNVRYYYDARLKIYRIYKNNYNKTIDKITYYTADWDEENIYITEYSAYTYKTDTRYNSFTRYENILPIGITDKNIEENLDLVDKYKYTFKFNKGTDNYYLNKIEYIK